MSRIRSGRYVGETYGLTFEFRVERRGDGSLAALSGDVTRGERFLASFISVQAQVDEEQGRIASPVRYRGNPWLSTGAVMLDVDDRGRGTFQVFVDLTGGYRDGFAGMVEWRGTDLRRLLIEIDGLEQTQAPGVYVSSGGETVTIQRAFADVGFDVEVRRDPFRGRGPDPTRLRGWTLAELHAAMEDVRSPSPADRIHAHVFVCSYLAGRDNRYVLGIMYDFGRHDLNSRPREGVAVFYDHPLLSDPRVSVERRDREFLFTAIHELGHALNLLHSFDKARPSALSWMNYPDLYPLGYEASSDHDGTAEFWRHFRERFDDEELWHLRHATPRELQPGGLPFGVYEEGASWAFGGTADPRRPAPGANPLRQSFDVRLELKPVAPGKTSYELGEPVFVAIAVRNVGGQPVRVPNALDPAEGYLGITVRSPAGSVRRFRPPVRLCKTAQQIRLLPGDSLPGHPGTPLFLSAEGPLFTEPGTYQIVAELGGVDGCRVAFSEPFSIRVESPRARVERFARQVFEDPGTLEALYLRHPLAGLDGFRALEEEAKRCGLSDARGNTTWSYLNYIGALGWMTPFARPRQRREEPRDLERAAPRIEQVRPAGLPASVRDRIEEFAKSIADRERGERAQVSVAGGRAPLSDVEVLRSEVPASGLFGGIGIGADGEAPEGGLVSPFVRVVDGYRGLRRFADVVTWNIEHLEQESNRRKIPRVAELIRSFRCDFWGLQEVDRQALAELIETLNSQGSVRYAGFAVEGRGQRNGCLWRTDTTTVTVLALPGGIDWDQRLQVTLSSGQRRRRKVFHREPLLAEVRVTHGRERVFDFRTAIVHLKSTDTKLRDRGASLRARAAEMLGTWMRGDRQRTGELDYLFLGDMNAETASQGLGPFLGEGLELLSVGMQERYGEENALTRVASRRLLDHVVVTSDTTTLLPQRDEGEQIIIRSDRRLSDFTGDYSDHVPVAVRFVIGEDPD